MLIILKFKYEIDKNGPILIVTVALLVGSGNTEGSGLVSVTTVIFIFSE